MEARAVVIVRAALNQDFARPGGAAAQRQIQRVQDQSRGAGRADGEVILAGRDPSWLENEVAAATRCAQRLGVADGGGREYAHQVLRLQPRARTPGADVP